MGDWGPKLSDWQVRQARWMFNSGQHTQSKLARYFNVTEVMMAHVLNRSLFKHL